MSTPGFEGPEKKLEIDFRPIGCIDSCAGREQIITDGGLRQIPDDMWQNGMLKDAACTILNKVGNDHFDAYLLSESSLFVYPYKVMIKTCGTTTLLRLIPRLLEVAAGLGLEPEFLQYSRSAFIFPDEQHHPHTSFDDEVMYLNQHFRGGQAYVLGSVAENARWHLYIADYSDRPAHSDVEQNIEIFMFDLDPKVMKHFFKDEAVTSHRVMTVRSGINLLMPEALIDEYAFEPCGYSMNGLEGDVYYTIHITPEDGFSYVSFECNQNVPEFSSLVNAVAKTFRPGRMSIAYFADGYAPAALSPDPFDPILPGFRLDHRSCVQLETNYSASLFSYSAEKDVKLTRQPSSPELSSIPDRGPLKPLIITPQASNFVCAVPVEPTAGGAAEVPEVGNEVNDASAGIDPAASSHPENEDTNVVPKYPPSFYRIAESVGATPYDNSFNNQLVVMEAETQRVEREDAFYIVDLGVLLNKIREWNYFLPRVAPYYSVKCNADPAVIRIVDSMNCGFACTGREEVQAIRDLVKNPSRILLATTCKTAGSLTAAKNAGVNTLVLSSEHDVRTIREHHPEASLLLAIVLDDVAEHAFRVSFDEAMDVISTAHHAGLHVSGVTFVVPSTHSAGDSASSETSPALYHSSAPETAAILVQAIRKARMLFDRVESELGLKLTVLDLGNHLPWRGQAFTRFAETIAEALDTDFPPSANVEIRAQPGRLFVSATHTLVVNVFGRRKVEDEEGNPVFLYYVNDGIYGSFSCLLFDREEHSPVVPVPLRARPSDTAVYPSTVFGPTCDGLDWFFRGNLPELEVGEWLFFQEMGSYTSASATAFNGFSRPDVAYVYRE